MAWARLIRFLDYEDKIVFGEPEIKTAAELLEKYHGKALYASEFEGNSPFALSSTGRKVLVKRLLEVLTPADVPIVRCIGLNYMKHSTFYKTIAGTILLTDIVLVAEGGRKPPPYPSLFIKPSTCVAGFDEDVPIPKIAQEDQLDYEGELVSHSQIPRIKFVT
jgi:2-keto-4-pentenoate hydratase/2-oxohepta-3-ene-1,7-dioic acid hydratase in catechol pathway